MFKYFTNCIKLQNNHIIKTNLISKSKFSTYSYNSQKKESVTITTPIYYVNGKPHIGHYHTNLIADTLARWNKMLGKQIWLSTGTDEHGIKIQQAAQNKDISFEEFCNENSKSFQDLWNVGNMCFSDFVRTTEKRHTEAVHHLWKTLEEKGYIYLGTYQGWYSISDEEFLTNEQVEDQLDENGKFLQKISKETKNKVEWLEESNYKFKLTEFKDQIYNYLKDNKVIFPDRYLDQVHDWIYSDNMKDLSISRVGSRIKWGIKVPKDDENQTIYVWLDALTNYLTSCGFPNELDNEKWPPKYQIIGKDILRFHSIYWLAFLMAADLELPKKLIVHSHWTVDQRKMSKSVGNVVCPTTLIEKYGSDFVRFFILSKSSIFQDNNFSEEEMVTKNRALLCDTLGNLVTRCTAKSLNTFQTFPDFNENILENIDKELILKVNNLPQNVANFYENAQFKEGISEIFTVLNSTNKYFTDLKPWTLEKNSEKFKNILFISLESIRICGILLNPIIPKSCEKMFDYIGIENTEITFENSKFRNQNFERKKFKTNPKKLILFDK